MRGEGRRGIDLQWLDADADEGWEGLAELLNRYWAEILPGEPPIPAREIRDETRFAPRHRTCLSVVRPEVAAATLVMDEIRPETAVEGWPAEDERHRSTRPSGRHRAPGTGRRPSGPGRRAEPLPDQLPRRGHAPGLGRPGEGRAGGYSLVAFDGVCPDAHLDAYTAVIPVMNTAPGEEARPPSAALVLDNMRGHVAQGNDPWTICARHDASRRLVAYTELSTSRHRSWVARQGDTGVDLEHRNRGLGRWLKAQNALRLLREHPEVAYIETWKATGNEPMLSINRPMGFRPVASWQQWELSTNATS